ncbi:MAG: ornithine carbamoyltransferase, partial [Calditrichaeota bacterium]
MKKDFISIADWSKDEIVEFLELATVLKNKQRNGIE